MTNPRLEQIHSRFNTPRRLIEDIVSQNLGQKVLKLNRIIAGEANEVYNIQTENNNHIIRIDHRESNVFEKEKWAKDLATDLGVPTPKVLKIGFLINNCKSYQYSLEEFVAGNIHSIYQTERETLEAIFEQAGAILSKIHNIQLSGFGDLNQDYQGKYATMIDKIKVSKLNQKSDYKAIAIARNLDWELINQLFVELEKNLGVFDREPSVLIHRDFNHKHFIVDDKLQIRSIIDWGEVHAGSPIEDFARWELWFGEIFPVEILTRQYHNQKYLTSNFDLKLKLMQLIEALNLIDYYDKIDDTDSFPFVMNKIQKILQ